MMSERLFQSPLSCNASCIWATVREVSIHLLLFVVPNISTIGAWLSVVSASVVDICIVDNAPNAVALTHYLNRANLNQINSWFDVTLSYHIPLSILWTLIRQCNETIPPRWTYRPGIWGFPFRRIPSIVHQASSIHARRLTM